VAREPWGAEVTLHLEEPGSGEIIAPSVEIEEATISTSFQTFLVVSSRIRKRVKT